MAPSEETQKAAQEAYLELQMASNQIKQLQKNIQTLDEQVGEINNVILSLDDFKNSAVGSDILVPITNGIFAKGTLKDNKELVVNVGADTVVDKDVPATKKLLQNRIAEIQAQRQEMAAELQKSAMIAQQTEQKLTKLLK